jgi:hypothetical protein
MSTPSPRDAPGATIGPDQVWYLSHSVVIYALREMPDWEVRGFQRIPIYYQKQKFYLHSIGPGKPPHAVRYELKPWPENLHDESKLYFTYDEAFVAERDRDHQTDRRESFLHYALMPLYPVLGLCWSGFKERVLGRYGFKASSITKASLVILFGIGLVEAIFLLILQGGYLEMVVGPRLLGIVPTRGLDIFLFFAAPADCLIRYSQILRGDDCPDGFLEWLFRWNRRREGPGT